MRSQANFLPERVPASSSHALQSREPLGPVPPDIGPRAAEARRGIPRRGQDRRVPVPRVDLPCLFQHGERLGGDRRPVFEPGLLVLCAPQHPLFLRSRCRTTEAGGWRRCGAPSRARAQARPGTASRLVGTLGVVPGIPRRKGRPGLGSSPWVSSGLSRDSLPRAGGLARPWT